MKLGLLGFPIDHSLSPSLYKKFLQNELESYHLFSFPDQELIPSLDWFSEKLDGLNITSPYKKHFISKIEIPSPLVRKLGAVNTLAFHQNRVIGTNTDVEAVVEILKIYKDQYQSLQLIILGDGVMANVTKIVAEELKLPSQQFSRRTNPDLATLDFRKLARHQYQTIVINTCSRQFECQGQFSGEEIFWDYNYAFPPHEMGLPSKVKSYQDGQEMLERQALAAIRFWNKIRS
jgi:shikimate dehydrogenase